MDYIIPSDNREQQQHIKCCIIITIISYQAITGNNNAFMAKQKERFIISYQAITGNNNLQYGFLLNFGIISYQAITGNNNFLPT